MLQMLIELLDRLRFIPGLGWLDALRHDVVARKIAVEQQARKINNAKKLADHNIQSVREIPSVIKGSKKRS